MAQLGLTVPVTALRVVTPIYVIPIYTCNTTLLGCACQAPGLLAGLPTAPGGARVHQLPAGLPTGRIVSMLLSIILLLHRHTFSLLLACLPAVTLVPRCSLLTVVQFWVSGERSRVFLEWAALC